MDLQTLSEKIYFGLCYRIGTSKQVTIRRDVLDIREILNHRKLRDDNVDMRIGSKREGFRLKDSDTDTMIWPNNHRVLWYFVQAMVYNKHIYALTVTAQRVHQGSLYFFYLWSEHPTLYFPHVLE